MVTNPDYPPERDPWLTMWWDGMPLDDDEAESKVPSRYRELLNQKDFEKFDRADDWE